MCIARRIRFITVLCTLFIAPITYAGFSTYTNDWPDDATTVDEKITTDNPLKQAAPDTNFLVVTDEEQSKRVPETDHLYAKLGMTFLTAQLRNISNTSQPALSSANVVSTSVNSDYVSWEFALGTRVKYVRLELEYVYQKTLYYSPTPLFSGLPESLYSKIWNQSAWLDIIYDFEKLNIPYLTPYLGGLVGVCWNKTRSAMSGGLGNGTAHNHSRIALGWGVTVGARVPFWTRWFLYAGYKYLDQGQARWQDSTGVMGLKGHSVVQGVDLGVSYILGS